MLQWFALAIVGAVFYGYFLAHLSYLYSSSLGLGYLLFVLLMTQLNDALGFIYGKAAGAPPLDADQPQQDGRGLAAGGGHDRRPDVPPGAHRLPRRAAAGACWRPGSSSRSAARSAT